MRARMARNLISLQEPPAPARRTAALETFAVAAAPADAAAEFRQLRSELAFRALGAGVPGSALPSVQAAAVTAPAAKGAAVVAALPATVRPFDLPPEFTWHDYTVFLLHVAAEIEHALMVQYLYAAWSLGGPQVPDREEDRRMVRP